MSVFLLIFLSTFLFIFWFTFLLVFLQLPTDPATHSPPLLNVTHYTQITAGLATWEDVRCVMVVVVLIIPHGHVLACLNIEVTHTICLI